MLIEVEFDRQFAPLVARAGDFFVKGSATSWHPLEGVRGIFQRHGAHGHSLKAAGTVISFKHPYDESGRNMIAELNSLGCKPAVVGAREILP